MRLSLRPIHQPFLLLPILFALACGEGESEPIAPGGEGGGAPPACDVNETRACVCTDGRSGAQSCEGAAFGLCVCEGGGGGTGGGDPGPCASSVDCTTAAAPVCAPSGRCVECTTNEHCGADAFCELSRCLPLAAGGSGGGGSGGGGPTLEPLAFTVTFPFLIEAYGERLFPSYLAHLAGDATSWRPLELACISIANPNPEAVQLRLEVSLDGYSSPASRLVTARAGRSTLECLTPTFDLTALYSLRSRTNANVQVRAEAAGSGATLFDEGTPVPLSPGSNVFWSTDAGAFYDSVAALVMPDNADVTRMYSDANAWSFLGGFGVGGYRKERDYVELPPQSTTIAVNDIWQDWFYLDEGEPMSISADSIVGGADADLDFYVFTSTEFDKWMTGANASAVVIERDALSGTQLFVPAGPGDWYVFVAWNTNDNILSRDFTWTREATNAELISDYLAAFFQVLYAEGINYISVPGTFFDAAQRVQWPEEMLRTGGGNCIDGAVLFSSLAELAGLEPAIVVVPGHAYMGVWSRPAEYGDARAFWPIETTMVEAGDPWQALSRGSEEFYTDTIDAFIDVRTMRTAGLRPIPR